eukprot:m.19461 g.19461  ORF g.19461 m.19461 type:complete len:130 (+) comp9964_c0_seq1:244-633(+)
MDTRNSSSSMATLKPKPPKGMVRLGTLSTANLNKADGSNKVGQHTVRIRSLLAQQSQQSPTKQTPNGRKSDEGSKKQRKRPSVLGHWRVAACAVCSSRWLQSILPSMPMSLTPLLKTPCRIEPQRALLQ